MGQAAALRRSAARRADARPAAAGCHLHGVIPADAAPATREVMLVSHREITALVRPVDAQPAASTRRELVAHADLLDTTAATTPVLPMRFGTVLASPEEVEQAFLAPHHDTFVTALATLAGRAQFTVRARYEADAIVREVVEHEPAAQRLHRQLNGERGSDHAGRVMLGEMVARAVLARREADTRTIAETLQPYAVLTSVQPSQSLEGYRIADAAFLVDLHRQDEFEQAVEQLAARWRDRVRLRLLGPMAAYHFADHLVNLPPTGR